MADAPPTRRRRLVYMEKGGSSSIPKSTLCRMRKEGLSGLGSLGSSQDSGDAASDACDVGSSGHDTSVGHISESDIASDELELSDVDVESTSFPSAEPSGGDPRAGAATATDALTSALREFGREGLPHSCTTKGEAVAMVMSLMVAGGLSWADLDNLLVVINTMFAPAADVLPRSKYLFRKLWTKQTDALIQYHFYCTCCCDRMTGTPDSEELTCQTCSHRNSARQLKNEGVFFVTLNMHDQLQHIIAKTKTFLQDALTKVPPPPGDISDVTEGRACREMRSSGTLNNDDVTLTVNTDGSPVFSSSGASVWPIQFLVNELPAPERFKHCTLVGLWFGKGHPNMALFLEQFVDGLNSMDPVVWEQDGLSHASRAYILCWCLDAPARAAVQNCTLFNGYIGCPWCLTRGEHLDAHPSKFPQYKSKPKLRRTRRRPDRDPIKSPHPRLPGFIALSPYSSNTPDIPEIIRNVFREEIKNLLPATHQPASVSIAEVVREEVQRPFQPEAPASVAAPEETSLTYGAVARRPAPTAQ
ncbi:hypothetical protein HPB47_018956 [Ixodes persulcatus]|uniref:Uncharacterized protein n=1 Tax=Ixodes persulcatus TaxID=34615 RepID=A0AC60QJK2_IXOPE|nr:hypothetical protein HPB47_018956 [Ixodes persulcatus]